MRTTIRVLAAIAAMSAVLFAATSVAGAQNGYPTYPGPPAPPENVVVVPPPDTVVVTPDTQVLGATAVQTPAPGARVQGSNLAFTGGEALTMAILGGLLLAGGIAITMTRRRQLAQI
jgi:hypothetical protein